MRPERFRHVIGLPARGERKARPIALGQIPLHLALVRIDNEDAGVEKPAPEKGAPGGERLQRRHIGLLGLRDRRGWRGFRTRRSAQRQKYKGPALLAHSISPWSGQHLTGESSAKPR